MMKKNENIKELVRYLNTRIEFLHNCNAEIEDMLDHKKQELVNSKLDNQYLDKGYKYFEYVVANTYRYAMLIAVCTFLEETLKNLSPQIVKDYKNKIRGVTKGTWLEKHRLLFSQCKPKLVSGSVSKSWALMLDIVQVRNCLAHAWGKVCKCKNQQKVKKIIDHYDFLELTGDGFIFLDDEAITSAIAESDQILIHLFEKGFEQ